MSEKKRVLILCTGNSARSQMAEGLLRHEAGDRFEVVSAGVERTYVRPEAVEAMREIGVDISQHRSKFVAAEGDENTKLNIFRPVGDEIRHRLRLFAAATSKTIDST